MVGLAVGPGIRHDHEPEERAPRKERGAFFTPPEIAAFLVEWAVRGREDRVLEPSCGEAAFLLPAARRLATLGAAGDGDQLHGVEIHAPSAATARRIVSDVGSHATVRAADFFDVERTPTFDAVVGNPPYIRYQDFAGEPRAKALRAAFSLGVTLTKLASSWAAFVVHAAGFLKPGGRLGLVLPAELLTVNYAAPVRRFLLDRFRTVRLVLFEQRVFPDVLEEVVLLMAEGSGGTSSFEVHQVHDAGELSTRLGARSWRGFTPDRADKWTAALVDADALAGYRGVTGGDGFGTLERWGDTYLGAVTGNNRYFTLTATQVEDAGLSAADLVSISPPRIEAPARPDVRPARLGGDVAVRRRVLPVPPGDRSTGSRGGEVHP